MGCSQGLNKSIYWEEFFSSSFLQFEWDFEKDLSFKDKMASVTTEFCSENRTRCALKEARRKRLSLILYRVSELLNKTHDRGCGWLEPSKNSTRKIFWTEKGALSCSRHRWYGALLINSKSFGLSNPLKCLHAYVVSLHVLACIFLLQPVKSLLTRAGVYYTIIWILWIVLKALFAVYNW